MDKRIHTVSPKCTPPLPRYQVHCDHLQRDIILAQFELPSNITLHSELPITGGIQTKAIME